MRVLAYRRSAVHGKTDGIEYVDKEQLIRESDFISFHCPLNDETRSLVNDVFLSKVKDGCYIINTSRGAVIDEDALYRALKSRKLAGAAIDVMVSEPPKQDNPLLTLDNCIITPHAAWVGIEARKRLINILCQNIESFLKTGKGINRIL